MSNKDALRELAAIGAQHGLAPAAAMTGGHIDVLEHCLGTRAQVRKTGQVIYGREALSEHKSMQYWADHERGRCTLLQSMGPTTTLTTIA